MPYRSGVTLVLLVGLFAGTLARVSNRAAAQSGGCDGAREAIATMSDPGASAVSLDPLGQQVVDLDNWPPPQYLYADGRAGGVESHVYAVTAELLGTTLEPNGDFDMLLGQPGDERWKIVAVLPDPSRCPAAAASREAADISAARSDVAATIGLHSSGLPAALTIVRVTGAGFFNPQSGGQGEAGNGLELSPVIRFALAGPATLPTFPVMPPGSAAAAASSAGPANSSTMPPVSTSAPTTNAAATGVSTSPPVSSTQATAQVPAADPTTSSVATANSGTTEVPTIAVAASSQQISSALAANAPSGAELPTPFSSAVLQSAGPGGGPAANAYDLDFILIDSGGQPGGALTYLVFSNNDDAQSALSSLQGAISQSGLSPQPATSLGGGSFCAQPVASSPAPCAARAGSVLVLTQAADSATALAIARAGVAHLAGLIPAPQ